MSSNSAIIDSMVAASRGASPSAGAAPAQPHASMSYAAGDPDATVKVLEGAPSQQNSTIPTRMHDYGQDVAQQVTAIRANLANLESQLNAVKYDENTGAATHVVIGKAREALQATFDRARQSAAFDIGQLERLAAQRSADAAAPAPASNNSIELEAAKEAFIGNGRDRIERLRVWNEEMTRQQAVASVQAALRK